MIGDWPQQVEQSGGPFEDTEGCELNSLLSRHCHVIGVSDLADLWVIKRKKPMILCARSTSLSPEQSTERRSLCENMWKVRLSDSQRNKTLWLSNGEHIFGEIYKLRKGLWDLIFDCVFRALTGWAGKLPSRGTIPN